MPLQREHSPSGIRSNAPVFNAERDIVSAIELLKAIPALIGRY